jgi:hypothetical protein
VTDANINAARAAAPKSLNMRPPFAAACAGHVQASFSMARAAIREGVRELRTRYA